MEYNNTISAPPGTNYYFMPQNLPPPAVGFHWELVQVPVVCPNGLFNYFVYQQVADEDPVLLDDASIVQVGPEYDTVAAAAAPVMNFNNDNNNNNNNNNKAVDDGEPELGFAQVEGFNPYNMGQMAQAIEEVERAYPQVHYDHVEQEVERINDEIAYAHKFNKGPKKPPNLVDLDRMLQHIEPFLENGGKNWKYVWQSRTLTLSGYGKGIDNLYMPGALLLYGSTKKEKTYIHFSDEFCNALLGLRGEDHYPDKEDFVKIICSAVTKYAKNIRPKVDGKLEYSIKFGNAEYMVILRENGKGKGLTLITFYRV